MMRILVTGSRNWTDHRAVTLELESYRLLSDGPGEGLVIVHGACPTGADAIAGLWARETIGVTEEPHPADWLLHGKAAGPKRNQEMVDLGADLCLAFPMADSRGTQDCMRRALAAHIPLRTYIPGLRR